MLIETEIQSPNDASFLYNPYYFMYASLISADSEEELHLLRDGKTRSTTGSIVSSLYRLKDLNGQEGAFFVFPDLSIRMEGSYRLKFSLFEIINTDIYYCASVISDVFEVYPAKKFPGMKESTALSKIFADQGLKIRIRKETRQKKRTKGDDDESGNEGVGSTSKSRAKRQRGFRQHRHNSPGGDSEEISDSDESSPEHIVADGYGESSSRNTSRVVSQDSSLPVVMNVPVNPQHVASNAAGLVSGELKDSPLQINSAGSSSDQKYHPIYYSGAHWQPKGNASSSSDATADAKEEQHQTHGNNVASQSHHHGQHFPHHVAGGKAGMKPMVPGGLSAEYWQHHPHYPAQPYMHHAMYPYPAPPGMYSGYGMPFGNHPQSVADGKMLPPPPFMARPPQQQSQHPNVPSQSSSNVGGMASQQNLSRPPLAPQPSQQQQQQQVYGGGYAGGYGEYVVPQHMHHQGMYHPMYPPMYYGYPMAIQMMPHHQQGSGASNQHQGPSANGQPGIPHMYPPQQPIHRQGEASYAPPHHAGPPFQGGNSHHGSNPVMQRLGSPPLQHQPSSTESNAKGKEEERN